MSDTEGARRELAELRSEMDDADTGQSIPYARFRKLAAKLRDLGDSVTAIEAGLAERDARIEELTAELGAAQETLQTITGERDLLSQERSAWQEERELHRAGLTDPEGVQVARTLWGALPEDQRPEGGIASWLTAEEGGAPRAVRGYLSQEATGGRADPQARSAPVPPAQRYTHAPAERAVPVADTAAYRAQRDTLWGGQAPRYPWESGD